MSRLGEAALAVVLLLPVVCSADAFSYLDRLALAERNLREAEVAQAADPGVADTALAVVENALELAWLTGDYDWFARAETALEAAEAAAGRSPRTCLVTARLHLTLHRAVEARAALQQCGSLSDERTREQLLADVLQMQGDPDAAAAGYRRLLNNRVDNTALAALAAVHESLGHPEEAKALLAQAERRDHGDDPAQRAWLKLRRAEIALHQGRFDEARAVLLAAEEALPGWWFVEEHLAEVEALLGQNAAARDRYVDIVERNGLPELEDALANVERTLGATESAKSLREHAREQYESRLKRFPEAAAGHALEHFLHDADAALALELAEANYAGRPTGQSATQLARARWRSGRRADACEVIESGRARGYESAEVLWLAAECAPKDVASTARALALNLNPLAAQMYGFDR
jgi:tetratricopeptide (TPR) repeat protein